jgi:hypothetical protein
MYASQLAFLGISSEVAMSNKMLLDIFGKELISEVRDRVIDRIYSILGGRLKSVGGQTMHEALSAMSSTEREVAKQFAIETVDATLHRFLVLIEQSDMIDVRVKSFGEVVQLREISDGLAGELYSDQGWIARFSKQPSREG